MRWLDSITDSMDMSLQRSPRQKPLQYVSCIGKQVLYHECHLECPEEIPKYKHISPKDVLGPRIPSVLPQGPHLDSC